MQAERGQGYAEPLFNVAKKAAAKGNVEAARALSSLYSIGGYKSADEDERLKWLQEAADAGDAKSQYEFGVYLYENGKTERSKELASQYLIKASKRGDAFAVSYVKSKNILEN
jgi:TPR repeat protein